MRSSSFRRRLLAVVLAAAPVLALGRAAPAFAATQPVPPGPASATADLEQFPAYVPADSCDSGAKPGVLRFADPTVVAAFGERVVVSHGDALCIDDVAYQRYRAVVRSPSLQRAFAALPLTARRAIGRAMRRRSGRRAPRPSGGFIDVDAGEAMAVLRRAEAPTLVHGHTHAPARHELDPGFARHVLSDWELDGSSAPRAEILRWSARGFERIRPESTPRPQAPAT